MRLITTALLIFGILFMPCKGFAQSPPIGQPVETCGPTDMPVQVKLKTGEKVKGDLLEKTDQQIKVCRKGSTFWIPTNDIRDLKTRMTGKQRFRHTLRVLGIFIVVATIHGYLRYAANSD